MKKNGFSSIFSSYLTLNDGGLGIWGLSGAPKKIAKNGYFLGT
jgi:hypothetical protein